MIWKQPIPTDLLQRCYGDKKAALLFRELILRAANQEQYFSFRGGILVHLLRGQAVFGRNAFAAELPYSAKTAERKLGDLQKMGLVKLCPSNDPVKGSKKSSTQIPTKHRRFTLVELIKYDELISMKRRIDPVATKRRPSADHTQEYKNNNSPYKERSSVTEKVIQEIAQQKNVLPLFVGQVWKDLCDKLDNGYEPPKGAYKNFRIALANWVQRRITDGTVPRDASYIADTSLNRFYDPSGQHSDLISK